MRIIQHSKVAYAYKRIPYFITDNHEGIENTIDVDWVWTSIIMLLSH